MTIQHQNTKKNNLRISVRQLDKTPCLTQNINKIDIFEQNSVRHTPNSSRVCTRAYAHARTYLAQQDEHFQKLTNFCNLIENLFPNCTTTHHFADTYFSLAKEIQAPFLELFFRLISAFTLLNHRQREQAKTNVFISTFTDFMSALDFMKKVEIKHIELAKKREKVMNKKIKTAFDKAKNWLNKTEKYNRFTATILAKELKISHTHAQRTIQLLCQNNLIEINNNGKIDNRGIFYSAI